jgi:hypothetical protein
MSFNDPRRALRTTFRALPPSALVILLCAGVARADVFKATVLLSASPFGQAEYAHDSALSEDGHYIVFDGSVGGVTGIWRRAITVREPAEQATAPLEQVAGGDAQLPSVSADGRYISFTTNEGQSLPAITDGLIQEGTPERESPGVYVRDMTIEPGKPKAFTLASAKDHSSASLSYEYLNPGTIEEERVGSTAAGRGAISADGRKVVFVTGVASDLAGPATPALQVAVRDLDTLETTLVSVRYDPATGKPALNPETGQSEPVRSAPEGPGNYGAVYTAGSTPPFSTRQPLEVPQLPGASISADGSTVAWLGQQISEQARTLSGEPLEARYAEPLWRRIGDGPEAPTRRVAGGSDPESPECAAHPEATLPVTPSPSDPCQGPFATQVAGGVGTWNSHSLADTVPRLSADGRDVAFLGSAPLLGDVGGFGLSAADLPDDVYWVDMEQPTRTAALRQLTQFASGEAGRVSTNAQIEDIGISPGGDQIAFTTRRTVFPLGTPAYVSIPAAVPGLLELYDVDLSNNTLTRVTKGYEGGLSARPHEESVNEDPYPEKVGDGALSPSFSADGTTLAFASTASNLVFGDGNTPPARGFGGVSDGSDAFLIPRITFKPEPTPQVISVAPSNPAPVVPWRMSFAEASLPNGTVEMTVEVPGAGELGASVSSSLRSRVGGHVRSVRRNVAAAARRIDPAQPNPVRFRLTLRPAFRALASHAGGLTGTVTLTFRSPGHVALSGRIRVRFAMRAHGVRRTR